MPENQHGGHRAFTLLDDQPYRTADDPLGFDDIAGSLAELILRSRGSTPLALGIESGWGTGKSTLMLRLADMLATDPNVKTVWFNAWTADDGGTLEGLVKSVLDSLDRSTLRRAARNERLLSWAKVVGLIVADWLRLGSLVNVLWREASVDAKARNEMRQIVLESVRNWAHVTELGPEKLLVIFVDDLDRCSPTNVLQVFEAIKLYLDAPGLVFVIGYDRDVVSDAILNAKDYGDDAQSFRYLEKIVQLVYRLPGVSDRAAARLLDIYLTHSATQQLFDETCRALTIEQNARNPRRIKRFINGFILEYGLDADWENLGAETLVRVLIIDVYFNEFGQLLRTRSEADPVQEFRQYIELRRGFRTGDLSEDDWERAPQRFQALGLPSPPRNARDALDLLEREIKEMKPSFQKLAGNNDFLPLIEGLGDIAKLREKLRRYAPTSIAAPRGEGSVFVSYTRADVAHATRLNDALQSRFGNERVFMDMTSIGAGENWQQATENAIGTATVVVSVIGPSWLGAVGSSGWLARELGALLARLDAVVIPVLVGGAVFPRMHELPASLTPLLDRQGVTLSEANWDAEVEALCDAVEHWLAEKSSPVPTQVVTSVGTARLRTSEAST
jgi:KAP family P-loop domain/TIR domain